MPGLLAIKNPPRQPIVANPDRQRPKLSEEVERRWLVEWGKGGAERFVQSSSVPSDRDLDSVRQIQII